MTDTFTKFLETHKDVPGVMLASLVGTYTTCQGGRLGGQPADLDKAYAHVLLGSCDWCRNTYARKADVLEVAPKERLFSGINHVAIIASNYERSKDFYVNKLGFAVVDEQKRPADGSPILYLNAGNAIIELFSFPNAPERASNPEARGLRHLALTSTEFDKTLEKLLEQGIPTETPRIDPRNNMRYTFFKDPDGLPLEVTEKIETDLEKSLREGNKEYAELREKYPQAIIKEPKINVNQGNEGDFNESMQNLLLINSALNKNKEKQ